MIAWRALTAGGFREASFSLDPGGRCRLLLASETDLTLFMRLLVGTERPASGGVLLFGSDLAAAGDGAVLALLARVGIVWPGGGFVSNLKTWENILLPLWYHGSADPGDREEQVVGLLERVGVEPERIPPFLHALPGSLPLRERRLLGVARAMMQDAELMIYAGLFEGLDQRTRGLLSAATARHHASRQGRASLFVSADPAGFPEPFDGLSLRQGTDGGIAPWA